MTVDELNKQIKSGALKPIYFFSGEEKYLLENKLSAIEKRLITPGTEDFNKFVFDGKGIGAEEVLEAAEMFPQMSDRKLIIVKNSGFFNRADTGDYKLIKEAANSLPEYVCIIFTEDSFDKKKEKNLKFIEEVGGVVTFDYMPVNRIEVWLEELFKKEGKRILTKDVSYMVRLCGQSLGQIHIEFEKLINYLGERSRVQREDIDAVVTKSAECRIYDMMDNVMSGRGSKALEQMKYLMDTKEQPTVVLGMMIGRLSEVLMCKLLREDGLQPKEMVEYFDFNKPLFAVNKTIEEGKRYGEAYLKRMIKKGLQYDTDIKNGVLNGRTAVDMYISELIN